MNAVTSKLVYLEWDHLKKMSLDSFQIEIQQVPSLRDSVTLVTLPTSFHNSWSLWTTHDSQTLPLNFWYKKIPL